MLIILCFYVIFLIVTAPKFVYSRILYIFAAESKRRYDTLTNISCLVMFNRVAWQDAMTAHNIRDIMGKSRKRTPAGTYIGRSQKRGKKKSHGRFRRCERMLIQSENFDSLPHRQYEITNQWDLGGDGKCFWGLAPDEEWFIRSMRK